MKKILLLLSVIAFHPLGAQSVSTDSLLSAAEAVRIALENNYDIRLARADADIAQINNTKGNAGMLPTVNLLVNENFTLSTFQQKLSNGSEFNALGAPFNVANAAVQLNWTLFDGRRMYITKKKLEALQELGQMDLRTQVQQTSAAVLQAYYDVVRNRLQERAIAEVIALNEERLRISEARLAAGFAAQTDALQAKIDLNQRKSDLISQQNATVASKRSLNLLLARPSETGFDVEELPAQTYMPDRSELLAQCPAQNPTLNALQKNAEVAALVVDETRTLGKPRIVGTSQFIAQRSDNGSGFLLSNTQTGLTVGASFVLPLYSGGNIRRQEEVAKTQNLQALTLIEAQRNGIQILLDNQLSFYRTQQQILTLEESSVGSARENLRISTERFRLGQTNALEVQSAQNSLEQVLLRRNLAEYNLKIAEIELKLLAGNL